MKTAFDFLQRCGVFYLATVAGDQPRVRPFGAVCVFEGRLYLVTNNQKDVYRQLLANPRLEISGMAEGQWIRLAAQAVRDGRREARQAMLEANPSLRGLYSEDDGVMEVLYLQNASGAICSFTAAPVPFAF